MRQWRSALVVAPDDALRSMIVELLAQEHFAAFDVPSISEARYFSRTRACALVVIDPGTSDADDLRVFLAELEAADRLRSVVVLTDRASIARVSTEAAVTCLREPFELDELLFEVQHATAELERKTR